MEQDRYPSGAPMCTTGFSGFRVARSLVFCIVVCLSFCHFSFSHCYLFFFDWWLCLYFNVDIFFFNHSQGEGVTRRVQHVEQELSGVRVGRSFVFCVMSCRPLFILLSFIFQTLCCLSIYLRLLITTLKIILSIMLIRNLNYSCCLTDCNNLRRFC